MAIDSQTSSGSLAIAEVFPVPGKQLKMDFYLLNQFNEINLLTTPTLSMASVAAANETKYKVFGTLNYLFLSNP